MDLVDDEDRRAVGRIRIIRSVVLEAMEYFKVFAYLIQTGARFLRRPTSYLGAVC